MPKPFDYTKEKQDKLSVFYSPEEVARYGFYLDRFEKAKNQRQQSRNEFDGLNYEQDYQKNMLQGFSHRRPKKNDAEVRIVTGTTEKKVEIVINELLSMSLDPEVRAFDQNDFELSDLGREISDIVKRTNEIEKDDDLRVDILHELVTQRSVFIEEYLNYDNKTKQERCEKRLLSGLQVYLGNINLSAHNFQKQPYIVKYERMSYGEAMAIYGDQEKWPKWKYVKPGSSTPDFYNGAFDYRLSVGLEGDEVEILHYQCAQEDEYQIIINGVMMLELGKNLPWEHEGYNMAMITLKPLHRYFAYGSSLVASARTLQSLSDETIRLMIRKFRQAVEPPLAVSKTKEDGKLYSKDIWNPGAVTYGLSANNFEPLVKHMGVTQSEFSMYELIESKVEEFIGQTAISQGMPESGSPTATEIIELRKQAIKMLGLAVYAYTKAIREASYLRIYNVFENYTKSLKKSFDPVTGKAMEIFRRFTSIDTELEDGKRGKKVIQFMDRDLNPEEEAQLYDIEEDEAKRGRPTRYKFINVKKLRDLSLVFFVNVTPQPKDSSALNRAMFTDMLNQVGMIIQLLGIRPNANKLTREFERAWEKKDIFEEQETQAMPGQPSPDQLLSQIESLGKTDVNKQMTPQQGMKPSINALANSTL